MLTWRLLIVPFVLGCSNRDEHPSPSIRIAILPLGTVTKGEIGAVKEGVTRNYWVAIHVLPRESLPKEAYYPPRSRYRAERLLERLDLVKGDYDKVIGVTERDISTTYRGHPDWGIMGLGRLGGKSCVVSTFRLKKRGRISPSERLGRISAHELGHTFGLEHCGDRSCVMVDGGGKIKNLDATSGDLCAKCRILAKPSGVAKR